MWRAISFPSLVVRRGSQGGGGGVGFIVRNLCSTSSTSPVVVVPSYSAAQRTAFLREMRECTEASITDILSAMKVHALDKEQCIAYLQKSGAAKIVKKASRDARQGIIFSGLVRSSPSSSPSAVYLIEVNTETDFAARNERFQHYCSAIRDCIEQQQQYQEGRGEELQLPLSASSEDVSKWYIERITQQTGKAYEVAMSALGERLHVRRFRILQSNNNNSVETTTTYGMYTHSLLRSEKDFPNSGMIGAIVALHYNNNTNTNTNISSETREKAARSLAQHLVATVGLYYNDETESLRVPLCEQKFFGDGDTVAVWLQALFGNDSDVKPEGFVLKLGQ